MALHIFNTDLLHSTRPLVVGAVSTEATLRQLAEKPLTTDDCDLLELRLDLIALPAEEVLSLSEKLGLPLLITARHPEEGGQGNLDVAQRSALLEALLPKAALIDIEVRSAPEMLGLIRKAQARKVQVVGSFHDFHNTPSVDVLRGAVDFGLQCRLNAIKLATYLRGPEDIGRLVEVIATEKRAPLSVMGMGELGKVSRLLLAKCGSVLNYGYLGEANAPGQWPARRLKELLADL